MPVHDALPGADRLKLFPLQHEHMPVDLDDAVHIPHLDVAGKTLGKDFNLGTLSDVEASSGSAVPAQRVRSAHISSPGSAVNGEQNQAMRLESLSERLAVLPQVDEGTSVGRRR